jgi:hypothetical protein
VDEDSSHFSDGPFYVSWYDGKKKQFEPAGRDPEHALRMVTLKRAALAYVQPEASSPLETRFKSRLAIWHARAPEMPSRISSRRKAPRE